MQKFLYNKKNFLRQLVIKKSENLVQRVYFFVFPKKNSFCYFSQCFYGYFILERGLWGIFGLIFFKR